MNEIQLNELKSRAEKLIGGIMPIRKIENGQSVEVDCKFIKIGGESGIGEEGNIKYQIDGILQTAEGKIATRPLIDIVRYLESKNP